MEQSLTERLRIRANIRRSAIGRKSVEEGKPDRIADLLEESANEIEQLEKTKEKLKAGLIGLVQENNIPALKGMRKYCLIVLNENQGSETDDDVKRSLFAINTLIEVLEKENENSPRICEQ